MIPQDLNEQLRAEVKGLKEVAEKFLHTYQRLCAHQGGPDWKRADIATVLHFVRREVIPVMQEAGMEERAIDALCSWAERQLMSR